MAFSIFKPIPLYLKVSTNRMELSRLDTGQSVAYDARVPFSNERIVFAHFFEAEEHLKAVIRELIGSRTLTPRLKILVQQVERIEGGLSSVERRALIDSCEHAGAYHIKVVEHERPLSGAQALELLNSK